MKTALSVVIVAAVAAALVWLWWPAPACPEWALRDVHRLYIDLADGTMNEPHQARFHEALLTSIDTIPNKECRDDYNALGPAMIMRSGEDVRAMAAAFLRRYGGPKFTP